MRVARVNFFPQLVINGNVGLESLILNHLFEPNAVIGSIAGGLVGPLINKRAIRSQYLTANARQLQSIYNYQRVILNAFTQVINRITMVENYSKSIEIKKQQLKRSTPQSNPPTIFFRMSRIEYIDVLFVQRDLRDARVVVIDTKTEQLAAIVKTYQALGGGVRTISTPTDFQGQYPYAHTVRSGENFWTISLLYYRSSRYGKALWAANKDAVPAFDRLTVGDKIIIPPGDQLDPALIEEGPRLSPPSPELVPGDKPAILPPCRRHHPGAPGPFSQAATEDPAVNAAGGTNPPRPRRSRRRRGSDVSIITHECPPGTVCHASNNVRRLLTSVDSEAINMTWMSCIGCPESWGSLARRNRLFLRGCGLHPASRSSSRSDLVESHLAGRWRRASNHDVREARGHARPSKSRFRALAHIVAGAAGVGAGCAHPGVGVRLRLVLARMHPHAIPPYCRAKIRPTSRSDDNRRRPAGECPSVRE